MLSIDNVSISPNPVDCQGAFYISVKVTDLNSNLWLIDKVGVFLKDKIGIFLKVKG